MKPYYQQDGITIFNADCRGADDALAVPNVLRTMPVVDRRHPNEKPLGMVGDFIRWTTKPGDLILDPFCGSGTTADAAKALGRKAIVIDIEERWCDETASRLAQGVLAL